MEEAEAFGVLFGLEELTTVYEDWVTVETDCATSVKELHSNVVSRSAAYPIIVDIKDRGNSFSSWHIKAISRDCNSLAHGLAEHARMFGDHIRLGDVPRPLRNIACNERVTIEM